MQGVRERSEVEDALERIHARPEFNQESSVLERFLNWLFENLFGGAHESAGAAADVVRVIVMIAAALLLAVLVVLLIRAARNRRRRARPADAVRARVAELRRAAAEARAAGDLVLALRLLLFALVVGLGQRGDLSYRDAWTNRELLERGRPSERVRGLLAPLIVELEAQEFGRAPVTAADVDRLEALCETWLDGKGADARGAVEREPAEQAA